MGILTLFGLENCPVYSGTQELTALVQIVEQQSEACWYHLKANNPVKRVEEIPSKLQEWQKKFIFIRGDWQRSDGLADREAQLDVPTDFHWLKCKVFVI